MGLFGSSLDPTQVPLKGETSDAVWIAWYNALLDNFSVKQANADFIAAWTTRGTSTANTSNLRTTLSANGLTIPESAWDSIVDEGEGAMNFFGGLLSVGKWTGLALVVIIVGGLGMGVYTLMKSPSKSAGEFIKYAK